MDFKLQTFNSSRANPIKGDPNGDALKDVIDWPFGYNHLEPYYAKVERLIGINGTVEGQQKPFTSGDQYQKPLLPNPISEFAATGMKAQGFDTASSYHRGSRIERS
jgi:choline dehydrogenase-like flavoprotein